MRNIQDRFITYVDATPRYTRLRYFKVRPYKNGVTLACKLFHVSHYDSRASALVAARIYRDNAIKKHKIPPPWVRSPYPRKQRPMRKLTLTLIDKWRSNRTQPMHHQYGYQVSFADFNLDPPIRKARFFSVSKYGSLEQALIRATEFKENIKKDGRHFEGEYK